MGKSSNSKTQTGPHPKFQSAGLVLAVVVLAVAGGGWGVGCSDDDGGDPLRDSLFEYCNAAAPAACHAAFSCCPDGERGIFGLYEDEEACRATMAQNCKIDAQNTLDELPYPVAYAEERAQSIVQRLEAAATQCDLPAEALLLAVAPESAMDGVHADGTPCTITDPVPRCEGVCTPSDADSEWICGPGSDVGGPCDSPAPTVSYGCKPGLICVNDAGANGQCAVPLETGETCSVDSMCASYNCSTEGTCEAPIMCMTLD